MKGSGQQMQKTIEVHQQKSSSMGDENVMAAARVKISAIINISERIEGIDTLYSQLCEFLEDYTSGSFELVFVDNGVGGDKIDFLEEISRKQGNVKLIRLRSVFSESSAIDAGIKASNGEILIYMITRIRIDPHGLKALVERIGDKTDLVVGWRSPRSDSRLNQWVSHAFNRIISYLGELKLHDLSSGVFVAKKEVLRDIQLYGDLDKFIPILAFKQGYKVKEEKIAQLPGTFRNSYYLRDYFHRILDIITIIFLTNYSKKPIHFLGFLGTIFALVGGVLNIYLLVYRLTQGPIAGRPLLLLGVLLFVIGIQMIAIGLLGEMIIYVHASDIKEYNIEEVVHHHPKDNGERNG
jgi:glycosyltransferase involved in cell wall biosynthesis